VGFNRVAQIDGTQWGALRTSARPLEYGLLGHYTITTSIQLVVTQAANGTLFSFRWNPPAANLGALCVITGISLDAHQTASATATIYPNYQVFIARSFTASDSAGTAITLGGNQFKRRTSMGSSLVADMRKSAVAAGLTVGTRTLDLQPILELDTAQIITVGSATVAPGQILYLENLLTRMDAGEHPHVLAANEGLIVRGPTIVFGAAGTAEVTVRLAWAELTPERFT